LYKITSIRLPLPLGIGSVNSYLVRTQDGFFLIDTGGSNGRARLRKALEGAGCGPGDLKMILLTHGDYDHTGNAAYLRKTFGVRIAMHPDDLGMAERGDMFYNRNSTAYGRSAIGWIASNIFGFRMAERFSPDLALSEGTDLSAYGFEGQVLSIPGHSLGSIAIRTAAGEAFCGDLLINHGKPVLNSLMDDLPAGQASLEKLRRAGAVTIYPGQGEPFALALLL
jgi:hydroxyacylglutathione hydrolase